MKENKTYINSHLDVGDYLYNRFSSDYMSEVGIPDPLVRSRWIGNKIQEERLIMDNIVASALEDRKKLKQSGILH